MLRVIEFGNQGEAMQRAGEMAAKARLSETIIFSDSK
jgi:hypothetical protein